MKKSFPLKYRRFSKYVRYVDTRLVFTQCSRESKKEKIFIGDLSALEDMSTGIIVLDVQNRIVDINSASLLIIGCSLVEVIRQPFALYHGKTFYCFKPNATSLTAK